jgi:hypothetical protein
MRRLLVPMVTALVTLCAAAAPASAATNTIATAAGTGAPGYNGDGLAATSAQLANPIFVAATPGGGYLIADQGNCRIRKVGQEGSIATVAGNGTCGGLGDTGPATSAQLSSAVNDVEPMPDGGFLIADANANRVRRVFANGTIDTVAGTGAAGYNGDGIAATTAQLNFPDGLAVRSDGSYLISDNDNYRIRNVAADGTITTVAGTGAPGAGGDGGPATSATLNKPGDVELTADGGYLISDTNNNRVRRVSPGGTITNAAGDGTPGFGGDAGPAGLAHLNAPNGLAVLADGGFLIADRQNNRIRRVGPDDTINTVAGDGTAAYLGDGGPATAAELSGPFGVSVNAEGDYLIADTFNQRVRVVDAGDPPPPTPPSDPPADPPPPEAKKTANLEAKSGTVLVTCPGQPESKLQGKEQVSLGCRVDATDGVVTLTAAADSKGKTQSADFYEGAFRLKQVEQTETVKGKKVKVLITELTLDVAKPSGCKKKKGRLVPASRGGHLWGRGKGRYRTRGRRGAGTVRGTIWLTEERCEGTYFQVKEGVVAVEDFTLKKTVLVKKGKSYLAPASKPKGKQK